MSQIGFLSSGLGGRGYYAVAVLGVLGCSAKGKEGRSDRERGRAAVGLSELPLPFTRSSIAGVILQGDSSWDRRARYLYPHDN